jgi:hypothetical protein
MSTGSGASALRVAPSQRLAWLAWSLAGVAGALAWSALGARAHAAGAEPVCLLRGIAHLACPTCGMTRALALLAAGEWREALALHPWAPPFAAQVAAGWAWWGLVLARGASPLSALGGERRPDRWLPHAVALNAVALLLIWLVRLATGTLPPV